MSRNRLAKSLITIKHAIQYRFLSSYSLNRKCHNFILNLLHSLIKLSIPNLIRIFRFNIFANLFNHKFTSLSLTLTLGNLKSDMIFDSKFLNSPLLVLIPLAHIQNSLSTFNLLPTIKFIPLSPNLKSLNLIPKNTFTFKFDLLIQYPLLLLPIILNSL